MSPYEHESLYAWAWARHVPRTHTPSCTRHAYAVHMCMCLWRHACSVARWARSSTAAGGGSCAAISTWFRVRVRVRARARVRVRAGLGVRVRCSELDPPRRHPAQPRVLLRVPLAPVLCEGELLLRRRRRLLGLLGAPGGGQLTHGLVAGGVPRLRRDGTPLLVAHQVDRRQRRQLEQHGRARLRAQSRRRRRHPPPQRRPARVQRQQPRRRASRRLAPARLPRRAHRRAHLRVGDARRAPRLGGVDRGQGWGQWPGLG